MNYDDPRLQKLKEYLLKERKLSIFTVKDIVREVKEIFMDNEK